MDNGGLPAYGELPPAYDAAVEMVADSQLQEGNELEGQREGTLSSPATATTFAKPEYWNCPSCKMDNMMDIEYCGDCGKSKVQEVTIVNPPASSGYVSPEELGIQIELDRRWINGGKPTLAETIAQVICVYLGTGAIIAFLSFTVVATFVKAYGVSIALIVVYWLVIFLGCLWHVLTSNGDGRKLVLSMLIGITMLTCITTIGFVAGPAYFNYFDVKDGGKLYDISTEDLPMGRTQFSFQPGAFVDMNKMGFSQFMGANCVAPVVHSLNQTRAVYWVFGTDCCKGYDACAGDWYGAQGEIPHTLEAVDMSHEAYKLRWADAINDAIRKNPELKNASHWRESVLVHTASHTSEYLDSLVEESILLIWLMTVGWPIFLLAKILAMILLGACCYRCCK